MKCLFPFRLLAALTFLFSPSGKINAAPGDLDLTFAGTGTVTTIFDGNSDGQSVVIQDDGKIVIAGTSTPGSAGWQFFVARYNTNGSLDSSFNQTGKVTTVFGPNSDFATCAAIQKDGKILVGGSSSDVAFPNGYNDMLFTLARYNIDGSLDKSFNGTGKVRMAASEGSDACSAMAIQNNGKIVLGGDSYIWRSEVEEIALARYTADGSLDSSFNGRGFVRSNYGIDYKAVTDLAIQDDGKIWVVGFSYLNGFRISLTRFDADGYLGRTVDTPMAGSSDSHITVALQSDGKIVVGGHIFNGSTSDFVLLRYLPTGILDTTFNGTGVSTISMGPGRHSGGRVLCSPDGKIVCAASSAAGFAVMRFNSDGILDDTFGKNGMVTTSIGGIEDVCNSAAFDDDGKIVVVGTSKTSSGRRNAVVVRYLNDLTAIPRKAVDTSVSNDGGISFVGENIVNLSGLNQFVSARVYRGSAKAFRIKIRNTMDAKWSFTVAGTAASAGFVVRYFDDAMKEITADVVSGSYRITNLPRGESKILKAWVRILPNVPQGAGKTCRIAVRPAFATDASSIDAITTRVTVGERGR